MTQRQKRTAVWTGVGAGAILGLILLLLWPMLGNPERDSSKSAQAQGGGGASLPLLTPEQLKPVIAATYLTRCWNGSNMPAPCACSVSSTPQMLGNCPTFNPGCRVGLDSTLGPNSIVENATINHYHIAADFQPAGGDGGGCAPCGGGGGASASFPTLEIARTHRYRNMTEISSFGPGIFSNYDLKFYLQVSSSGTFVTGIFDPKDSFTYGLGDSNGDGVFDQGGQMGGGVPLEMRLYNASGMLTTNGAQAVKAVANNCNGNKFEFSFFLDHSEFGIDYYGARLTKVTDSNGRGVTITYKTWTPAQIAESPTRQWQIDTVSDSQGRTATFTYGTQQVSGRWVVSQIALPGSRTLGYEYTDGKLSRITYPGGAESTFTYGSDSTSQTTYVQYHDIAAGQAAHDKVYLSDHISQGSGGVHSQSALVTRMIENALGEVAYASIHSGSNSDWIYEGKGRMASIGMAMWKAYYTSWELQGNSVTGTTEPVYGSILGLTFGVNPSATRDEQGVTRVFTYSTNSLITRMDYGPYTGGPPPSDYPKEEFAYNSLFRITRHRDRSAYVTKFSYDGNGNVLTREVGIKAVAAPPFMPGYPPGPESDVNQPEYAVYTYEYYPAAHQNENMPKAEIDPLGNRTDYEYDAQQRLTKVIQPPDDPSGPRAQTVYAYDTLGRISTVTDPMNRMVQFFYDDLDRVVKMQYGDGSTERTIYGTGTQSHLVLKRKDRAGIVTAYEYDSVGRITKTIYASATMDLADNETPITDPSIKIEEVCTYLPGTESHLDCTRAGEKTSYAYDYRQRVNETTVRPNTLTLLKTKQTYVNNRLFSAEDPYGRKTYCNYRDSDKALVRTILGTVPSFTLADYTAVAAQVRNPDPDPNGTFIITDWVLDDHGRELEQIDGRNIHSKRTYDSRDRLTEKVEAFGTAVAAKTQLIYDSADRVTETRHARHFATGDPVAGNCKTTRTYTGRGLLKTETEAAGTPIAATTQHAYNLDGTLATRVDPRNNTWTILWSACCSNRMTGTVDPTGSATSTEYDYAGRPTHTQVLKGAEIFTESTTRYDARGRVTHHTIWLVAPPVVDPNNPPIAGENGVPAANGLTTRYTHDENLTDSLGLDATFATHLTGLNLGAGSDGNAMLVTDPNGDRKLTVQDGMGRSIRQVVLTDNGNALAMSTTTYDTIVAVTGFGDVVETAMTNGLNHTNRSRSDGAGRTIQNVDAENFVTAFTFDASGSRLSVRDPNNVGLDCTYDAHGRDISCTDTRGDTTQKQFDLGGNVIKEIDAKNQEIVHVYDARNRRTQATDRIGGITQFAYDPNSNLLSLTDAENQTTSYEYEAANRQVKETYPDHQAGSNPGDTNYGIVEYTYDGAGRMATKKDQVGDYVTYVYDKANRLTAREYRERIKLPTDPPNDTDSFTYDSAGHILTAVSGRYNNTVTFTYDDAGRVATEALTIGGQTYTIGRDYDLVGRMTTITYPDGSVVTRQYTPRDQLSQLDYQNSSVASLQYDQGMRETQRTFGNGLVTTKTYRTDDQLESIATPSVGNYSYTYDENKSRTGESITGIMTPYGYGTGPNGYDAEDRLVTWSRADSNRDLSWTLTAAGNWQQFTENSISQIRTHGPAHELAAVDGVPLSYDVKGNLIQRSDGRVFQWDFENQLKSSTLGANTIALAYDAFGRLAVKQVSPTEIRHFVHMTQPSTGDTADYAEVAEYSGSPTSMALVANIVIGTHADDITAFVTSGVTYYNHVDATYSGVARSTSEGAVPYRFSYSPYGELNVVESPASPVPALLETGMSCARKLDNDLDLLYNRARWYDYDAARFLTRDPISYAGGINLYEYCESNPTTKYDPSGHLSSLPIGGGGYGGGGSCTVVSNDYLIAACKFTRPGRTKPWTEVVDCPGGDASACCHARSKHSWPSYWKYKVASSTLLKKTVIKSTCWKRSEVAMGAAVSPANGPCSVIAIPVAAAASLIAIPVTTTTVHYVIVKSRPTIRWPDTEPYPVEEPKPDPRWRPRPDDPPPPPVDRRRDKKCDCHCGWEAKDHKGNIYINWEPSGKGSITMADCVAYCQSVAPIGNRVLRKVRCGSDFRDF